VTITNNGAAPEAFFVDPRFDATQSLLLTGLTPTTVALPMTGAFPAWFVPTQTSSVSVSEVSTLPAMFDFGPNPGDPDLPSSHTAHCATSESASYTPPGGEVPAGFWYAAPTECGPYAFTLNPPSAPSGSATVSMTVQTKGFDQTVSSTTGDLWLLFINPAATFSPLVLNPGQTGTISVTITPSGASGTVVTGTLYLDDFVSFVPPYGQGTGDELAAFPYTYTIK